MKILNLLLFVAACAVVFLLGSLADPSSAQAVKEPNPMKVNHQQYTRLHAAEQQRVQEAALAEK